MNIASVIVPSNTTPTTQRTDDTNQRTGRLLLNLLVFVVVLVILNLLFGEMDWGIHISIAGSLVLTFVVWASWLPQSTRAEFQACRPQIQLPRPHRSDPN